MNLSSLLGLILSFATIAATIFLGTVNADVFLNEHALIIVFGGTLSVALIMFPIGYLFQLARVYIGVITGSNQQRFIAALTEIISVARLQHSGQSIKDVVPKMHNAFFKESLELVLKGGLSEDEFEDVLEKRLQVQNDQYKRDGATFKVLGKFPPAFGLVGTTVGMITLLQSLGSADAFKSLGPAMSTALVATFYGLILANFIIIPAAENLLRASQVDLLTRRLVVDGVRLIKQKKHPLLVEEYLVSYLKPSERNALRRSEA